MSKIGDVDDDHKPSTNLVLAACFEVLEYFSIIALYAGLVCITYGVCTFEPPAETWPGA